MTGRKKQKRKKQNKKNKEKSRREEDVPSNVSLVEEHVEEQVEELSCGNNRENPNSSDGVSRTSKECQPLPPDELYFKNTEFTKSVKIQSRCYVYNTVEVIKKLKPTAELETPELDWFQKHPQFCHFFHMPDEPNLKLLAIWMLLLRTIPLPEGENAAWFAVNGVPIRYSMREHALISGYCNEYPAMFEKLGSFAFVNRHFKS